MTINEIQDNIISDFSIFEDDVESKLMYLMDIGDKIPPMSEENKINDNLIKGCMSRVWVRPEIHDGKVTFEADSNTKITKGLISLLVQIWNGKTPHEIVNTDLYFIDKIGMSRMIGFQRGNGLEMMINHIHRFAFKNMSI